jgi:maltose-binding protein MalE
MSRRVVALAHTVMCRLLAAALLAGLAACSFPSAEDEQTQTAKSAANSAIMVIDNWTVGAVPSHYAKAALRSLAETLADYDRHLQTTDVSDSPKQLARQLTAAAEGAEDAVTTGNRAQAEQARQDFRTAIAKFGLTGRAKATNP